MDGWPDGGLRDDYIDSDAASGGEGEQPEREPDPPSFSRIDLGLDDAHIAAEHPSFPGKASAMECELNAGEAQCQETVLYPMLVPFLLLECTRC